MEGLKRSLFIFAGLLAAIGVFALVAPKPAMALYTQEDLEQLAPRKMFGQTFVQSFDQPEKVKRTLNASGIVDRIFEHEGDYYNAVVILSKEKDSFHDPNICFSSQGWTIESQTPVSIPTDSHGEIPAKLIEITNEREKKKLSAYLYKGPEGYYGDTNKLKIAFLKEQMLLGNRLNGVFYRFIPTFSDPNLRDEEKKQKLIKFMSKYMDEANESSEGVL